MLQTPARWVSRVTIGWVLVYSLVLVGWTSSAAQEAGTFDHEYRAYGQLLRDHVDGTRVDYARLVRNCPALEAVVRELAQISEGGFRAWSREQQLAYWINAYNVFTLKAIVDNYPIQGSWFSLSPRNSIKQINGVWDELTWNAGGRHITLDQIEHEILRPDFKEPRIHFAINCASISCPRLRREPYRVDRLDRQLTLAARDYLAGDLGLQVDGSTLRVSSLFYTFGHDFIPHFAHLIDVDRSEKERAILGVIARYGPKEAAALAREGRARIRFLKYDWGLNDITSVGSGQ